MADIRPQSGSIHNTDSRRNAQRRQIPTQIAPVGYHGTAFAGTSTPYSHAPLQCCSWERNVH